MKQQGGVSAACLITKKWLGTGGQKGLQEIGDEESYKSRSRSLDSAKKQRVVKRRQSGSVPGLEGNKRKDWDRGACSRLEGHLASPRMPCSVLSSMAQATQSLNWLICFTFQDVCRYFYIFILLLFKTMLLLLFAVAWHSHILSHRHKLAFMSHLFALTHSYKAGFEGRLRKHPPPCHGVTAQWLLVFSLLKLSFLCPSWVFQIWWCLLDVCMHEWEHQQSQWYFRVLLPANLSFKNPRGMTFSGKLRGFLIHH